jgi:hypothetical protein
MRVPLSWPKVNHMRPAHALWLLGVSIALSGCALVEDTCRNIRVACTTPREEHREKTRNAEWAEEAWQTVARESGGCAHSCDFAQGFKDGFAEYLFRGGCGEVPLAAPLRYRDIGYQNPQGYQAIQDWFDGYRLGTARAHDSGVRKWITGPPILPLAPPPQAPLVHDARSATLGAPEPERKAWLQAPQNLNKPPADTTPKSAPTTTPKSAPTPPPAKLEVLPSEAPRGGAAKLLSPEAPIEVKPVTNSESLRIHAVQLAPPDVH